jgi:uncharacterized protein YicC (UPF0701 family)
LSSIQALALEIRSVNHRYLTATASRGVAHDGTALREAIAAQMSRGKVECRVSFTARASANIPARINLPLLRQLALWNAEVRDVLPAARDLGVADILRWNGILESNAAVATSCTASTDLLHRHCANSMPHGRVKEKLKHFLLQRVEKINVRRRRARIPAAIKAYEAKLRVRLLEALATMTMNAAPGNLPVCQQDRCGRGAVAPAYHD